MDALLAQCHRLKDNADLGLADLRAAVRGAVDADAIDQLVVDDDSRPYGRKVLHDGPHLEMMVASWTRDVPCAPHDHGGSVGAVRVLRGEAIHRIWKVVDGELVLAREERAGPGAVLGCGPDMIHSMVDGGAEDKLATLHLYTDPIPFMVVYDVEGRRTLRVAASCGAWVPGPELVLDEVPGLHRRVALD